MKNSSPIIIIGMHRSGTTMLTKLLEDLGLFVGEKKRKNYEATFFQKLNKYLLYQANTSWDFPKNIQYVDGDYQNMVSEVLKRRMNSPFLIEFLGLYKYLKYRKTSSIGMPWGWKDPVNSITIDTWKQVFPEARIIYVYRNPIDVANSLKLREKKRRQNRTLGLKQKTKQVLLHKEYQFNQSYLIQDLQGGIDLWKQYVSLNEASFEKYRNQSMRIKYEDFLEDPVTYLTKINEFCNLDADSQQIHQASKRVDPSRKFGFLKDQDLRNEYEKIKSHPLMLKLGYDTIEYE